MDHIFPDEILLQLFGYLPRLDLFRGFYNLNSRLNRIIDEFYVSFRGVLSDQEELFILPHINPTRIRSFYVCQNKYQYSKLDQCTNLDYLQFSSSGFSDDTYRINTYREPQLVHVQPKNFPHLRNLTIFLHSSTNEYFKLFSMIFGNQFPTLESVHLPFASGRFLSGIQTWSTSIKYVHVQCCNKQMFYPLLDNLPNLRSFNGSFGTDHVGLLKNSNLPLEQLFLETYDSSSSNSYARPSSNSDVPMMYLDELINLYRCLPNLVNSIIFILSDNSLNCIMDQLNSVLSNCPRLKHFECFIESRKTMENRETANEIKQRYPVFRNGSVFTVQRWNSYLRGIKR
jgi:hypothetical protein